MGAYEDYDDLMRDEWLSQYVEGMNQNHESEGEPSLVQVAWDWGSLGR